MRIPRNFDDRTVEALLAGRTPVEGEPLAPLAGAVVAVRQLGRGPAPRPSGALAAILTEGVEMSPTGVAGRVTEKGDSPVTAGSNASEPARRLSGLPKWRKVPTMFASLFAWIASLSTAAKAVTALTAAGALAGGGVAVDLPGAVSDALDRDRSEVVEEVEEEEESELEATEVEETEEVEEVEETEEVDTEEDEAEGRQDAEHRAEAAERRAEAQERREAARQRAAEAGDAGAENSEQGLDTARDHAADEARIPTSPGPEAGAEQREQAPAGPETGAEQREQAPAGPETGAEQAEQAPAEQAEDAPVGGPETGAEAQEDAPSGAPEGTPGADAAEQRGPRS